jgi:hypothetical protein
VKQARVEQARTAGGDEARDFFDGNRGQ